jgi:hypothetical protein
MPISLQEAVDDALSTVRLVPRWRLDADEWQPVEAALDDLDQAITSGDVKAVRFAMSALEDLGPTRLMAIPRSATADQPPRDPPSRVLELVNTLVHPSSGWSGQSRPPATSKP